MDRSELLAKAKRKYLLQKAKEKFTLGNTESQEPVDSNPEPKVVQEQHPNFSFKDRAVVKNLGGEKDEWADYLRKQNPGMEIDVRDGQVIGRDKGEKDFKVLDPSGLDLQDVTDLGWDIGSGLAEGAATVGGFIAGGPVGAVGAGVGSGAGLETVRQSLGAYLGASDGVDPADVAVSGVTAGASPLLFGMDKVPGKREAMKGAFGKAYDFFTRKAAPKTAEMITGVPARATRTYMDEMGQVDALDDNFLPTVENIRNKVTSNIAERKSSAGQKLNDAFSADGKAVDLTGTKDVLRGHLDELKDRAIRSGRASDEAAYQQAKDSYQGIFGTGDAVAAEEIGEEVAPDIAFRIQQDLANEADAYKLGTPRLGSRHGSAKDVKDKVLSDKFLSAYHGLNDAFETATDGVSKEAKDQYAQVMRDQELLKRSFKDEDTVWNTLRSPRLNKRAFYEKLGKIDEREGLGLADDASRLEAYSYFGDPSSMPISNAGTTSTSRSIPLAGGLGIAGSAIGFEQGGYPGMAVGGAGGAALGAALGSPAMLKRLIKAAMRGEAGAQRILSTVPDQVKLPLMTDLSESTWESLQD